MKDFTPPLRRLSIGNLRSIVLLDAGESRELTPHYAYLSATGRVKTVFGDHPFLVVGKVNVASAILYDPEEGIAGVYVDSVYGGDALTRIADSLAKLYEIVLLIKIPWEGKEHLPGLDKTPENFALRDDIMREIRRSNPESDAGFWNKLAFRELDIRLSE